MTPPRKPSAASALRQAAAPVESAEPPRGDFAIREDDQWRARQRKGTRPARITLNLPADLNREFQVWLLNEAAAIGVTRISQQDALRIIIREMVHGDPARIRDAFLQELR